MPTPLPSALRALEPRFMFDAAAVATGAEVMADKAASQQADQAVAEAAKHTEAQHAPATPAAAQKEQAADSMQPAGASQQAGEASRQVPQESSLADALAAVDAPGSGHSTEIVFIDRSVQDASTLLSGIDPRAEIVFIDDRSDGLDQIAAALEGRTDVSAIHILSHGDPGEIELGNTTYDNATLTARAAELAAIGTALTSDGDILLYGCSTADGVLGEQFTHSLSRLTGADVAASTNTTGASALGGDWALEYQVGVIGSLVAVDAQAQARYDSTLDATAATGKGAVLAVYGKDIESIDVTTGKATVIATVPGTVDNGSGGTITVGNTINAVAVDRVHGLIYYQDGSANTNKTLFAYDYLNNTHFVVEADLTTKGITLGSQGTGGGGATFANGVMYLGVEDTNLGGNGNDTIYKVNFAADGRTITTTSVFVQATAGGADWGDLAIDTANNALLSVARTTDSNNNAIRLLDRYDLTSGALLSSTNFATNSVQMSVDASGNVYVLGGTTITQINPTTGAVIATTNVTSNGSTAVTGTVTDGADGVAATGRIGDQIFQDNNADGIFNGSDVGIANVTVQLIDDANGNGIADANERVLATDTTNAGGGYLFNGVLPGQYVVQVTDTNRVLGGNVSSNGTAARAVSIATIGGSNLATDFAYQDKAAPIVDLNSGTTTADIATNGSFTGNANGWTTGGTGTTYSNNHVEWTTDNSSGTLTQSGLTGLQSGPASTGAGQVEFGFGWNNSATDTNQPATLTVSVGGVVYATLTTGVTGTTGVNTATITYQNGASGPSTSVGSSTFSNWTYSTILINLPTTVANSGSLVFAYNSGNGSQGDDISIDNVKVLTSTDQTAGRDWNASYTENGTAISISDTDDAVLDNDSANISSGVVTLTNPQAGDRLLIGGTALTNGATGTVNGISYSVVSTGSSITVNLSGTATKAAYAAAIQAITFDNTRNDPASTPVRDITVTVSDGTLTSNTAHSFITVVPVNDAPVNTLPASYSGLEDSTIALSGLSVADADAGTGNLTITLSVASGAINAASAGGVVVGGTAAARTFTGTLAQLNAYLAGGSAPTYTPVANFNGSVTLTMSTNDGGNTGSGGALTDTDTRTITVTSVNDAPQGADKTVTLNEDTAYTVTAADFGFSDTGDSPANAFTQVTVNAPSTGTLTLNGVAITSATSVTIAQINAGNLVYTPPANGNGAGLGVFTFQVKDDGGTANGGVDTDPVANTISFNVTSVNDAPVGVNDSVTINEDTAATGNVLANDTDVDSPTLTVTQFVVGGNTFTAGQTTTLAGIGTLRINTDGSYTFTPVANYNGAVPVATYTVSDGALTSTATLGVTITSVNDAPLGTDKTVTVNEDTAYTVTAADFGFTDPNDSPSNSFTQVTVNAPSTGTLSLNGVAITSATSVTIGQINAGNLVYTPPANGNGTGLGAFTFQVRDDGGTANGGVDTDPVANTISFNVTAVNDAPVGVNDTVTTNEDTVATGNVLANDTDVDGNSLTVTQFVVGGTTYTAGQTAALSGVGTLRINTDGSYTFTPAANYNGAVPAATYTVSDGALTSTATLSVTLAPVNDAPTAVNDAVTTPEDTAATGNVLTNDSDVDGNTTLTITQFVVGGTTYAAGQTATLPSGTLQINVNGSYTFTPASNYAGAVPVATYTVSDGALTSTATLSVTITSVNDAPLGTDKTVTLNEDTAYTVTAADFGFTDPNDLPANAFTQVTVNAPTSGTLTLNGVAITSATSVTIAQINVGNLVYTPTANGNGAGLGAFTFQVKDDGGTANGGVDTDPVANTISFNVTSVNDAPVGVNDSVTINEDTAATGNVLANDTDVDSPTLTVTQFVIGGTTFTAGQTATLAGVGTLRINADGGYTFNPAANYNGAVPVATYTVSDGALTSTATLSLAITPVNDAPTAVNDTVTTPEDTAATGNVLTNDSDVDGNSTLTVTQFVVGGNTFTAGQTATLAGVGTLQINADGGYTFNPAANFNGAVPVATYTVSDGALTSTATLTVSITPVNDAPTAVNDIATTLQNTPATGNVLANDGDVDGNTTLTVDQFVVGGTAYTAGQTASLPSGTLQIDTDGSYTFTPATNYNGAVPVATYTVSDGALTSTATLSVTVTAVNQPPVGVNDAVTTNEDTAATGNVLTNDTDPDSPTLAVTQFVVGGTTYAAGQTATLAGVGTLQVNAEGSYTFNPAADFNGAVPVATYTVSDGALTSTATLSVTLTPVNDAPTAVNDAVTTPEDTAATGNVLTNDSDVDGNSTLTVTQFVVGGTTYAAGQTATLAGVGTFQVNADGSYTFNPATDYNGAVPVATYTVSDGVLTSTATLSVTITPVNDAPTAVNDIATTLQNTPATGNVLANDGDVDGNTTLTVDQFVVGGTAYTAGQTASLPSGTLQIDTDGSYTFTPATNYNGAVPVATYTVSDGALTSTATLSVTVTAVNQPPVGLNDAVTTNEDTAATGNVLTNDTDVDSLTLAVTQFVVGGTTYTAGQTATLAGVGTLQINANGSYTFNPAANYNGAVPVATYTVSDGALTSTATLSVAITPVNDAPTAVNDTVTTLEDTVATGNVLTNDSDVDGNSTLTVTQFVVGGNTFMAGQTATLAGIGTLQFNADGSYTFNPAADYNGTVPVATYTISDGALTSTATLAVTITPVNDAPTAVNDTVTTLEDTTAIGNVLTNDRDVDGNSLTVTQFVVGSTTYAAGQTATLSGVGTLRINTDGSYTFTPAANYNGAVPAATYTVSDGALTSTATLSVTLAPVNDAPTAVNDAVTTPEDTAATGNVLTNDSDVDGNSTLTVTQFVVGGNTFTAGQTATLPGVGTLQINADGGYTFNPAANYNGAVPVATYTVSDGALTSTATLSVTITPVNDAPTAVNDTATALEDTPATGNVLANDSDVDGNTTLTVTQFVVGGSTYIAGQTATLPSGTLQIDADGSYTFTPAANYSGAVPVATYTVTDGTAIGTATLSVAITPVNDAPAAVADAITTLEDTPATGNVLTNDSDVDGNTTLAVTQFVVGGSTYSAGQTASLTGVGTLRINTDGSYTFNPAANYNGAVPVATYTVSDGALSNTATLSVAITPVDDAPTAVNDTAATPEDTPATGNVLTNDSDVDGNTTLTVTQFVVGGTTYSAGQTATLASGTLQINADGSYAFTPADNYNGAVPVATYTVTDGALTGAATLAVSVTPVADVPTAVNDTVTTLEDTPATGNVLTNDSDVDGNTTLAVTQFVIGGTTYTAGQTASLAGVGTLRVNADGSYTFNPAANYNGAAPVATYTVSDGALTSTATLSIGITPVNDAPTAINDSVTALQNTPAIGNVLSNDSDVDGNTTLTVTQFVVDGSAYTAGQTATLAGVGTLQVNADGSYTFSPAANYNGTVPVATYTVSDGALTSTATLSVSITAVNDVPVAVNDTATTLEDTPATGNVLTNDSDAVGNPLTVTQFVVDGTTYTAGQTATLASGALLINADGSYTFTPAANYNGPVPAATYTTTDGQAAATAALTVSITPVNDAPTAVNDTVTTLEDTLATGNVLSNDSDVDSPTLTVTQFAVGGTTYAAGQTATLAGVGTLQVNTDGSYTFNPAANYNGAVPVATYIVSDGAATSTATLSVSVTPVNDVPAAVNDTATALEDTPVTGNVLANDSDVEGSPLSVTRFVIDGTTYTAGQVANLAGVGTLLINTDGTYTFAPAANYNGPVPVATYTVSDGALTSTATLSVAITPVNDAPNAVNDTAATPEDTLVSGNVLANDSDVDGNALGVTRFVVGGTAYTAGQTATLAGVGTLQINADGSYAFAPAANYNGAVPVATYTVSDGTATSTATLGLTVAPVNDAPTAVNDSVTALQNTPVSGNVLANDSDVDGNALGVTQFVVGGSTYAAGQTASLAGIGTLQINADGSYTFTPATNYTGAVPVTTYTVSDGSLTSSATLSVAISPVNDVPVARDDTATTLEDTPVSGNVLANDSDSVGNPLAVTQFVVDGTSYAAGTTATLPAGTLVINPDGSYTFTPAPNFNGAVPLVTTYTATDGLASSTATLRVSITPVNDAPTAINDTATTPEDTPVSGNVLANDSDVDSPALTVTGFAVGGSSYTAGQVANLASVGTLRINADGSYAFNPAADYNGAVPVATYTVSDGALASTATLTIAFTPVNDAPRAVDDSVTALQNTPVSGNVLANDSDVDGNTTLAVTRFVVDGSTYTAGQTATLASIGTLQVNADGRYTFTPATNYTGAVPATTYTVSDGTLTSTATLSVAISPVNDVPVVRDDTATTLEDTPVSGNVLANDSDSVGNPLTVTQFIVDGTPYTAGTTAALPSGTLVINTDGSYTFTPAPNYNGAVPLVTTYTASDGIASASGTLSLNITPVNDAPTAVDDTATTPEDTPVTGNVLANDSDVDSPTLTVTQFTVGGSSYTAGATAILGGVGTLRINADGGYTFNPTADYNGPVPVATYTVSDGALTRTATLSLTITPVNDAPIAVDDAATTLEDTPATGNVLVNDRDVDGNTRLTVTQFAVGGSTYTAGQTATLASGTLRIDADGSYLFTPAPDYNGPVPAATYTVSDGALTGTATLSLRVTAVNDAPVARPDTGPSDGRTPTVLNVLGNDSDPEGGPLVVSAIDGQPITVGGAVAVQGGRVGLNADGTLTFTPDPAFTGTPQFSYTVADASGATATAGVTLTVGTLVGADVQQLLGDGPAAFNGGRDPGMIDTRRDPGRETMYVPPYIIGAVNGIRSLNGTDSVDALGPIRAAVDGIRSLGGTQPIDVAAPILDLVENLQQRFRVIDPTQALFERQGESELVEARNSGDVIVLSNGDAAGAERGDLPPRADASRGALPPAQPATPERPVSSLLFSEQLAFQAGQGTSDTDLLFAALMAELEPSESTSSL